MSLQLPVELEEALEAFESGAMDMIIRARRKEHFEALQRLVSTDAAINKRHRRRAVYALGRWGDASVVPDIQRVLPELDQSERITALDALGRLGTAPAAETVAEYANDPSPQVRKFVVQALGRIGGPEARARLRSIADEDQEEWLRGLAARQAEKR